MRQLPYRAILLAALLPSAVQAADDSPWTFSFFLENDLFAETDRHYTNGVRFSAVSPDIDNYLYDPRLPQWVREVNDWFEPFYPVPESRSDEIHRNIVLTAGQLIYTPEDIDRTSLDPDDRPYAGWLYGGVGYHAKTRDKLNSVGLNFGVVGPAALGQEAQDLVHDLRGFDKFQGWDNQLENEPGLQLVYEHKSRLRNLPGGSPWGSDLIWHAGGSLGNVATYVNAGAELRAGWQLPDDFGTSALRPGGDNSAPGRRDPRINGGFGVHAFLSLDGRWVLRDIFLDGNTWRDSHSVDKEPLVGEAAYGVSAVYRRWKVSYAQVRRSREFEGQAKGNSYGSLSISYSY
ncbi:membrane protein [Marinobacterium nitratireducens]|uniref:Membrane protein n=1 Tax=Marinobacterium nitratireducens TaxID=518897 RepID=A0A917ZHT9_9GAMM|nr:lipid A deacylase LpxR family protein [Marinobacterium nitratireducens]GGO83241.1 membrane protein [Marinobacterium nitratireducens]